MDECGECFGDGANFPCEYGSLVCDESECPDEPYSELEILYSSDTAIAGFQFEVSGLTVLDAGGGAAVRQDLWYLFPVLQ